MSVTRARAIIYFTVSVFAKRAESRSQTNDLWEKFQ
jgi:hypothetical protein